MKTFFLFFLFVFAQSTSDDDDEKEQKNNKFRRITRYDIINFDKKKVNLFLFYYNNKDFFHKKLFNDYKTFAANIKNTKYLFGYVDVLEDEIILRHFRLNHPKDTGVIIYHFSDNIYYVHEKLKKINELEDLYAQIHKPDFNWSSNNILEYVLFRLTKRRFGQKAQTVGSFLLCVFASLFYIGVNVWVKRSERNMLQQRLKKE